MALPPTIPTSFVPRQPIAPRSSVSGFNPFLFVAYILFTVWIIVAILVFAYTYYLEKRSESKAQEVTQAQQSIDEATVNDFIRLRDRFTTSKDVLNRHVYLSQFLDRLEEDAIQNARFSKLKITVEENRTAKIELAGSARNFNALASQSTEFARDKDIKNAIFSGFSLDQKSGLISFQVNADLDISLVTMTSVVASLSQPQPTAGQSTSSPTSPVNQPTSKSATTTP